MPTTAINDSAAVASWWYGRGQAVAATRLLEQLGAEAPDSGLPGVVTVVRDQLRVAFVEPLKTALPLPWQINGTQEAVIGWDDLDGQGEPDPAHPVALAVLGTDQAGALVTLNLNVLARIQFTGDRDIAAAVVNRWVLELISTHPETRIGITNDIWTGPYTQRVQPVTVSRVPAVDVLIVGGGLSYADRAQIFTASRSAILLDLGDDAANRATWTIQCGADNHGEITNGRNKIGVTLLVPGKEVIERCQDLLISTPGAAGGAPSVLPSGTSDNEYSDPEHDEREYADYSTVEDHNVALDEAPVAESDTTDRSDAHYPLVGIGAQTTAAGFFDPSPSDDNTDPWAGVDPDTKPAPPQLEPEELTAEPEPPAAAVSEAPQAAQDIVGAQDPIANDDGSTEAPEPPLAAVLTPAAVGGAPRVAPIWNRILGPVQLCPPAGTEPSKDREKRYNELTVLIQLRGRASVDDIIAQVFGGAASERTVTTQMSTLRKRIGNTDSGSFALPHLRDTPDGRFNLERAVRSDWMEFDDLVQIIVDRTDTESLAAAMDLVTGPPFGGVGASEWPWAKDLRDQVRDRVAETAKVLAGRYLQAGDHQRALQVARQGLDYDNRRQDLWQVAVRAAKEGHDQAVFRELRNLYQAVPSADRDPVVVDLIGRG
ncbi:Uncharacterised protein [Mycobacteroides abscessus subsp. abscessus]|uniref:bacterial transcriptional activator domain-containing protein n=1 Tax=Mycobacteroides abscessus TaxID=36809 RepID=UPI00092C8586|nr:bacterial transcriptional activator domain-containing protein [Mycobacteroides abscessus]SIJ21795.1 Uncharacterised protein [Mycobacteroides abscessus subsp. abscessus]SLH38773.1 Uncharacterised protein [Mycobacteroides abscessus subsp. abscessus]